MALPVIIDCDPGHDDAIALVLALASPELAIDLLTFLIAFLALLFLVPIPHTPSARNC